MDKIDIIPFAPGRQNDVIDLVVEAWQPVLAQTRSEVPEHVYENFYPNGWEQAQKEDVEKLLRTEPHNIWLAVRDNELVGFLGVRISSAEQMGAIHIMAVSPRYQRQGIGRQLMTFAEEHIRRCGMRMMIVETLRDQGHQPARAAYEGFGFQPWPIKRYFKKLP